MASLFRMEQICGGKIFIDGVDTSKVTLQHLRSRLCIIPQDPVLFSATVRFNIDPFNESTTERIWEVLSDVNMIKYVEKLPNKLDEQVVEGGDNFSAGQRQLICIARALLRRPKILIMVSAIFCQLS